MLGDGEILSLEGKFFLKICFFLNIFDKNNARIFFVVSARRKLHGPSQLDDARGTRDSIVPGNSVAKMLL